MPEKPNILLIFPDQHRADTMGCAGHPVVRTPNIDRIAGEGVRFGRCNTSSPLCMPARASLMNGQYVNTHGIWDNNLAADRHGPSHVRNIRDAGYHTAVIGKTHLYVHGGVKDTRQHVDQLHDWGFQDCHELTGPWASANINSEYTDYLQQKGLLETHREYIRHYLIGMRSGAMKPWQEPPSPLKPEDHLDIFTGRVSADWIRKYNGNKPFYLQVCFPGPHDPFDSTSEYRAMYRPEDMPIGIMDKPGEPVPPYVQFVQGWSALEGMTPQQKQIMRTFYYGKVTQIDDGIGMILRAMAERGFLDNTWIVYTSDHGEMLGDHFLSHKIVFYEGALKIPLIVRPPRGVKGWTSNGLTDHLDIAATLLDIAGAKPFEKSDGASVLPVVSGGPNGKNTQTHKQAVFSEVQLFSMALTDRYKMVVNSVTREPYELYDMHNDPNELHNLVSDPAFGKVRAEMLESHLSRLLSNTDQARLKRFQDMQASRGRPRV